MKKFISIILAVLLLAGCSNSSELAKLTDFTLNNVSYNLPTELSNFLDNGWEQYSVHDVYIDLEQLILEPESYINLMFMNSAVSQGTIIQLNIANMSKSSLMVKDCMVVTIMISRDTSDDITYDENFFVMGNGLTFLSDIKEIKTSTSQYGKIEEYDSEFLVKENDTMLFYIFWIPSKDGEYLTDIYLNYGWDIDLFINYGDQ